MEIFEFVFYWSFFFSLSLHRLYLRSCLHSFAIGYGIVVTVNYLDFHPWCEVGGGDTKTITCDDSHFESLILINVPRYECMSLIWMLLWRCCFFFVHNRCSHMVSVGCDRETRIVFDRWNVKMRRIWIRMPLRISNKQTNEKDEQQQKCNADKCWYYWFVSGRFRREQKEREEKTTRKTLKLSIIYNQ